MINGVSKSFLLGSSSLGYSRICLNRSQVSKLWYSTNPEDIEKNDKDNRQSTDKIDLVLSILNSSATTRETKQFISRYDPDSSSSNLKPNYKSNLINRENFVKNLLRDSQFSSTPSFLIRPPGIRDDNFNGSQQNLQNTNQEYAINVRKTLRITILKIRNIHEFKPKDVKGVVKMIVKLQQLGVSPVVILDASEPIHSLPPNILEHQLVQFCQQLDVEYKDGQLHSRPVRGLLEIFKGNDNENKTLSIPIPDLIYSPLHQDLVPVLEPVAYDLETSSNKLVSGNDITLHLCEKLSISPEISTIEKIIFIDPLGGIPSVERSFGSHVFINLQQEYADIVSELHIGFIKPIEQDIHLSNLETMKLALANLPDLTSGIITNPESAGTSLDSLNNKSKNPIIYNILTNRPTISSSLPVGLKRTPTLSTSVIRSGMPVEMLYSDSGLDLIKLAKEKKIDLERLWSLIDDSFGKTLDREHYLKRINKHVAGLIIVGDYEGCAIITWEQPSSNPNGGKIAYLDKLAVLQKSQGSNGVADVVFKAMTIHMFPKELIWRSRVKNPVNKWYFDRAKGSFTLESKIWKMFWCGRETREVERFKDYKEICSSIIPSFKS